MTDQTIPPAKPLTQGQVRNLTKLVLNDYEQAERDLRLQYQQALDAGKAKLDEEFNLRAADVAAVKSEIETMEADWKARMKEFEAQLAERGFEPARDGYTGSAGYSQINLHKTWQPAGRRARYAELEGELERAFQVAFHKLRTARGDAERQILLASITTEAAQQVLAKIPKASELFKPEEKAELPSLDDDAAQELRAATYTAQHTRGQR